MPPQSPVAREIHSPSRSIPIHPCYSVFGGLRFSDLDLSQIRSWFARRHRWHHRGGSGLKSWHHSCFTRVGRRYPSSPRGRG
ncbi:hypothetical protein TIFTF001_007593 [Ficus carica]|uniref:Uncharacterized protein n=1 Tax=Ficus carica TaxID=3494 RepID=A0AA88D245_FICCA|nr:hypothetical protein TIFTF001_007593 [Ficus carica]